MMAAIVNVQARRGSAGDLADVGETHKYLTKFQIEKLTYMFNTFFDSSNSDGHLEKEDVDDILEKFRKYCGFVRSDERFLRMNDIMQAFYSCMVDQVVREKVSDAQAVGFATWEEALKPHKITAERISLAQWLNMWGRLSRGAAGISGFPDWVRLVAQVFFNVIDRDLDGVISYEELRMFYSDLIGIDKQDLDKITKEAYRSMTANEDYALNLDNYMFCFANFLLGKDIYGPGKFIFGVFDNSNIDSSYKVKYNADD